MTRVEGLRVWWTRPAPAASSSTLDFHNCLCSASGRCTERGAASESERRGEAGRAGV